MSHFTLIGSAGFDIYVRENGKEIYSGSFMPPYGMTDSFEQLIEFKNNTYAAPQRKLREITINMPTYTEVKEVYVGLDENSVLEPPTPYAIEKPIVYYGHSITQGGCVSRPGLAYPAYISRWLDCDFINLGFSGNAKGELSMAEYIASLDPSVFVMDYDHNAPSYEHLEATHYAFYERFRALRPTTPVVMVTAPDIRWSKRLIARRELILRNYETAVAAGDTRVFFVDGEALMSGDDWDSCTVDASHPNDLGHYMMAKGIAPAVKEALTLVKK